MNKREERRTEFESVKRYLEKVELSTTNVEFPPKFLEPLILDGIRVDLIQPGRVVFSMNMPPRLLNSGKYLHGGALVTLVDLVGAAAIPAAGFPLETGVSVEINVSCLDAAYVDEEIEIDTRVLRVGKTVAVVSVEFRKKKTGQIFAQAERYEVLINIVGVSVEINVSFLDAAYVNEEIEIDTRVLRVGKTVAVVSVEFRKKKTGQVFAQGRHTKYLPITSKM